LAVATLGPAAAQLTPVSSPLEARIEFIAATANALSKVKQDLVGGGLVQPPVPQRMADVLKLKQTYNAVKVGHV
jgi:hypothetical protein